MLYVIICIDTSDSGTLRADNREPHLTHLKSAGDQLKLGGRTTTVDGQTATGSILVVDMESMAEAEAFANNDPFAKAGLFTSVTVLPWACGIGTGLQPG